jgi:pimeloyl-ACP methyl ester carboxylesterase
MFMRAYPERVAGVVFVDAANSLLVPNLANRSGTITILACTAAILSRFGVMRWLDPFGLGSDSEGARRSAAITYGARPWTATCGMARGLSGMRREFERAPPLPSDIPIVALSASSTQDLMPPFAERFIDARQARADLDASQKFLAERVRGTWKTVPESSHLIADSQPDAVADAVFDMLDSLRNN